MAPEQLEGRRADHRADIFAFGAVLYEVLTGRRAFDGSSQASVIAAILEREPVALSTLVPVAPPALDALVRGCLHKDPEERRQSAHDVASELHAIADQTSAAHSASPGRPAAPRRRSVAAVAPCDHRGCRRDCRRGPRPARICGCAAAAGPDAR